MRLSKCARLPWLAVLLGLSLNLCNASAQDPNHVLYMDPLTQGFVGENVFVSCYYDNLSDDLFMQGYAWGVCTADTSVAEFINAQPGANSTGGALAPSFYSVLTYPEGWTVLCVTDFFAMNVIPPGTTGNELAVAEYLILTDSSTELEYCDNIGQAYILVADTNSVGFPPVTSGGMISTPIVFARGDADGNGTVSGLIDGLFILNYQFNGGATPPCLDAADVDGNGVLTGLLDALYVLNFQFAAGDPPPAPGPTCGITPALILGCLASECP